MTERELLDARRECEVAVLEALRVFAAGTGPDASAERVRALADAWVLVSGGRSGSKPPHTALRG